MDDRINDKVREIEEFLEELEPIIPPNFDEYEEDFKSKAACERYFEKIVEATVDLAFLVIRDRKLAMAEDDTLSTYWLMLRLLQRNWLKN